MEHYNPLLTGLESPEKFITVGEIMLRLTPPNYEKIRMRPATAAAKQISPWLWPTWAWTVPFSPWFPTTAWERAPSVC